MPTFNTFNEIQNVRKPIEIQRHYRNPSIQMHEEVNAQRQMFCQSCGRSCNCARNAFSMIKKF